MKRQYWVSFVGTKVIGSQRIFPVFGDRDVMFEKKEDPMLTLQDVVAIRKFIERDQSLENVVLLGEPFELKVIEPEKEEKK